jgi:hypothetical protein
MPRHEIKVDGAAHGRDPPVRQSRTEPGPGEHLHQAAVDDHHVGRLDVVVDDVNAMAVGEHRRDLCTVAAGLAAKIACRVAVISWSQGRQEEAGIEPVARCGELGWQWSAARGVAGRSGV